MHTRHIEKVLRIQDILKKYWDWSYIYVDRNEYLMKY